MSTTNDGSTTDDDSASAEAIQCPVEGCEYEGSMDSVAAHVLGTRDDRHSLDDLRLAPGDGEDFGSETGDRSVPVAPEDLPEDFDLSFVRDALVLLELVREYDVGSLDELDESELTGLYALLADLRGSADEARRTVRNELLDRLDADRDIDTEFGEVTRYSYEATDLEDEERVAERLERAGVDPESVTSLDPEKVERAVEETDLRLEDVFEVEEVERLRLTDADADERREKLRSFDPELRRALERL